MKPPPPNYEQKAITRVSWPIVSSGVLLGLFLSFGVLSGDELGRVNLLYLLVLFLAIPLLSVTISTLSMIRGKGLNLARFMTCLPLLSTQQKQALHRLQQQKVDKYWLYLQSQYAAIGYAAGSLAGFLFLLLFTDINFVWRSSILAPGDLLQPLTVVAAPWWFWEAAQPSLTLLQATQDSRLAPSGQEAFIFTQWWPFILATQVVYSFAVRALGLIIGKGVLHRKLQNDIEQRLTQRINAFRPAPVAEHKHRAPVHSLPDHYVVINWDGFEQALINQLEQHLEIGEVLAAGPLASEQQHALAESEQRPQVLLVKAWEPPLGELGDYLQNTSGLLLPINITDGHITRPAVHHLDEWLRFAERFARWKVYLPAAVA